MKHRLRLILMVSLLLANTTFLGSRANLCMLSLFQNESITSTSPYGARITLGYGSEDLHGTASVRFQHPDTNITSHLTKRVHGKDSMLTGDVWKNLAFFSHAQDNGHASLIAGYSLSARTPCTGWHTRLTASLGGHLITSWSSGYDKNLFSIAPHLCLSLSQALFDHLFVKLFITTNTLCLPEGNFSYYYGLSLALEASENLILQVRPLVRLSDYPYESMVVTLTELSFSAVWTEASKRKHTVEELGVWL